MIEMEKFEIDFLQLQARFTTIVIPHYIEGFVYSFFNYYDETNEFKKEFKKEITVLNDSYLSFNSQRDSSLHNAENNVITLHSKEVELINKTYFFDKANSLYRGLTIDLDSFYFNHHLNNQFLIKEKLQIIKDIFYKDISPYINGKISNLDLLTVSIFKDFILRENNKIISSIDQKLQYLDSSSLKISNSNEPVWKRVAVLFAKGEISIVKEKGNNPKYFYKDIEFGNINNMSTHIENELGLKKGSFRPYISDTINENSNKNIFDLKYLKILNQIKAEFIIENKKVTPYYELRLKNLSEQNK